MVCPPKRMMSLAKSLFCVLVLISVSGLHLEGQRVLLSDPGKTYNDTDGPTIDLYGPVDISTCSAVRFELDYNFSLPWEGGGNMETSDECVFGIPPCPGNPATPLLGGCSNCWDFLWAQFLVNGAEVGSDLIGETGTTNAEQSGSMSFDYCTMGLGATASINISTQTWAGNESVTFSNLMIICYEAIPTANANPDPLCDIEELDLIGSVVDPGVVSNSTWTGPGNIDDPNSLTTFVTDVPPGVAIYTLTVTDDLGCMSSDQVMVTVHPTPMANMAGPLEECDDGSGQAPFNLTLLDPMISLGMGTVNWYRDAGLGSQILTPNLFLSGSTTVFAVVDNGFCESEPVEIELIVLPTPRAFPTRLEKCEEMGGSGLAMFDLSTLDDDVNGGSGLPVTYFLDPTGLSPVPSPYTTGSTSIYAKVTEGKCESDLVRIDLIVLPKPFGNAISIELCEDYRGLGTAVIDLSSYIDSIVVSGNPIVDFFEDAFFQIDADDPYTAGVGVTILYVRLNNGLCDSEPIAFQITVLERPGVRSADLEVCEDPPGSGQGLFELDSLNRLVIGGQTGLTVRWFADSNGADTFSTTYFGTDTVVYVQTSNGSCESEIVEVNLTTISKPVAQPICDTACSDQSGTAFFDLTAYDIEIASDTSREEVFYASDSNFLNPVNANFRSDDTIIYARVERGGCYSDYVEIKLVATAGPILSGLNDAVACDSFILPVIPGINLSPNASYFLESNGQGVALSSGDYIKNSTKIYVFDQLKECIDQDSFEVTIVPHPEAGDSNAISVCDGSMVDLSNHLVNADIGGSFEDSDMTGALNGNTFNSTGFDGQTVTFRYIVDANGPCDGDTSILLVNVQKELRAGRDTTIEICLGDTVDLNTLLMDADLGGQFEDQMSTGALINSRWISLLSGPGSFNVLYNVGDGIVCPEDEAQITINVLPGIVIDPTSNVSQCGYYVLPAITGTNTQFANYFDNPRAGGSPLIAGDTIRSSMRIYIIGESTGYCPDSSSFFVDILSIPSFSLSGSLCADSIVMVGTERFDMDRPSGNVVLGGGAQNGCDSIVEVDLSFYPLAVFDLNRTLCFGQNVMVNGKIYDENDPTGTEILKNASFHGCDSTVHISLTYEDYARGDFETTICTGDSILVNGNLYHEGRSTGQDTLLGQGHGGCDSIVDVQILFNNPISSIDSTMCEGDRLVINGNVYDSTKTSGVEILIGQGHLGCDSTVNINLTFERNTTNEIMRTLCFGDSLVINGTAYNELRPSGRDTIFGGNAVGCDSLIIVELDFRSTADAYISQEICSTDTVFINGIAYHADYPMGRDTITGGSNSGCDSVIIVDINVVDDPEGFIRETLCPGDQVVVNGTIYDQNNPEGVERLVGQAINGCDSVIYIDLDFESNSINPGFREYVIELGDSVQLDLTTSFVYDSIVWTPSQYLSCTDCLDPWAAPTSNQLYTVTIYNKDGCSTSAQVNIIVKLDTDIFIPNIFSPNGDVLNDRLQLYVKEGKVASITDFSIYSRWGELVYREQGTNPDDGSHLGWDGTFNGERAAPGVFVYSFQIELRNGRSVYLSGSVTLIE